MSRRALRLAVGVVGLGGVAIAGYLVQVRASGGELVCSTGGCETVQRSSYAELLGIPVAVLGLLAYLAIVATALARGELACAAGAALALGVLGFSAYLLVVQLAVIDAVCDWCVANDVVAVVLAPLAVLRLRAEWSAAAPRSG